MSSALYGEQKRRFMVRGANTLGALNYGYDNANRRTSMSASLARMNMPQPVSAASYDAANELTTWGTASIAYDAAGNLINDGSYSYTWDARGQLSSLGGTTFQYDGAGRRTQNASGVGFLYDGANSVQELSGATPTANLLSGAVDENFQRTDASGSRSFITDGLGSTLALTDLSGNVQTQYTFDPFGNTSSSGTASTNPAQYTGRELDTSGLYFYRARYYNPQLGRFISEDPIGFAGSRTNFYAYALDNPAQFGDPFGLNATITFWPNDAGGYGHVGVG